jgi:hypothetical protein
MFVSTGFLCLFEIINTAALKDIKCNNTDIKCNIMEISATGFNVVRVWTSGSFAQKTFSVIV